MIVPLSHKSDMPCSLFEQALVHLRHIQTGQEQQPLVHLAEVSQQETPAHPATPVSRRAANATRGSNHTFGHLRDNCPLGVCPAVLTSDRASPYQLQATLLHENSQAGQAPITQDGAKPIKCMAGKRRRPASESSDSRGVIKIARSTCPGCPHGRRKFYCKDCSGASICQYSRQRSH